MVQTSAADRSIHMCIPQTDKARITNGRLRPTAPLILPHRSSTDPTVQKGRAFKLKEAVAVPWSLMMTSNFVSEVGMGRTRTASRPTGGPTRRLRPD